jgi:hypothetical protein
MQFNKANSTIYLKKINIMIERVSPCILLLFSIAIFTDTKSSNASENFATKDVISDRQKWHTDKECPFSELFTEQEINKNFRASFSDGRVSRGNVSWRSAAYYSGLECGSSANPETLYVVSETGDFYFVNTCSQPKRSLLDLPKLNSNNRCHIQDLSELKVVHSLILGKYTNVTEREVKKEVAGAGEIFVDGNSKVTAITSCSGHYKPTKEMFTQTINLLKKQKVVEGDPLERCELKDKATGNSQGCEKAVFWHDSVTRNIGECIQQQTKVEFPSKDDLRQR